MKKVLFAIFAHPDDESFGPSGTLLMETKAGTELHLISLTSGQAGMNPDNYPDLGAVRKKEHEAAGKLIGAMSIRTLDFNDGCLCNESMLQAVDTLQVIIDGIIEDRDDIEIEFMSSDLNGISGHIDHIVAARATSLVFYRMKQRDSRVTRLRLSCITDQMLPEVNTDWLFMEAGRPESQIDETIDAREYFDEITEIMQCHQTQRSDLETHLKRGDMIAVNHFIVLK